MAASRNKLLESARLFERIIASTHDVIWVMDLEGQFLYVSPSVFNFRGYTAEEVMSLPVLEAIDERDRGAVAEGLAIAARRIAAGERNLPTSRQRIRQPHRDGHIVWSEVVVDYVFDEDGVFQFILGVTRDIGNLVREEEDARILIESLQASLREIRALRGYLPVCSSCRKVRSSEGAWLSMEEYLSRFRPIAMSHGLCEECLRALYPGIAEDIIAHRQPGA